MHGTIKPPWRVAIIAMSENVIKAALKLAVSVTNVVLTTFFIN